MTPGQIPPEKISSGHLPPGYLPPKIRNKFSQKMFIFGLQAMSQACITDFPIPNPSQVYNSNGAF